MIKAGTFNIDIPLDIAILVALSFSLYKIEHGYLYNFATHFIGTYIH
jgi:hypothetical protein